MTLPDPLTDWLRDVLPSWASPQIISGVIALVVGIVFGRSLTYLAGWWAQRLDRINADDALRTLSAKRHNEHLKLISTYCNTLGAAVLGSAFIVPYIQNHAAPEQVDLRWVAGSLLLHFVGHLSLRFMKNEA